MTTHSIRLGPGDDVVITGTKLTSTRINAEKTRIRVKDNRPAPAPNDTQGTPIPATPIDVTGDTRLGWDIHVKGSQVTARQLLVASGGSAAFTYEPPEPP